MKAVYTGAEALTFNDYIDLDTGRTLTAVPGGVYDITPASGHAVPDVPEPWFTLVEAGSSAGQPGADAPAPDDEDES